MSEIAKCRCGATARITDDFAVARDPAVPEPAFGPRHTVPVPDGHYEIECLGECGVYVWARTVEEATARWNALMRPRPVARLEAGEARVNFPNLMHLVKEERPGRLAPRVLPMFWRQGRLHSGDDALADVYREGPTGLTAMLSVSTMQDGSRWLHLSVSRNNITPTWDELITVKNIFLGDREAVQFFPKREDYVRDCRVPASVGAAFRGER